MGRLEARNDLVAGRELQPPRRRHRDLGRQGPQADAGAVAQRRERDDLVTDVVQCGVVGRFTRQGDVPRIDDDLGAARRDVRGIDRRAVVATPTGSTSYSLSVGGPIVDPRLDAIIVSAIAPFAPNFRPIVFPPKSRVRVRLTKPKECLLVLDGQKEVPLKGEETLEFTASEKPARFIRFRDDFYQRIEQKLARP